MLERLKNAWFGFGYVTDAERDATLAAVDEAWTKATGSPRQFGRPGFEQRLPELRRDREVF